jgi:hypothetical protein
MAPPNFVRSVNPISTKGGRLCPPNNTGTPGFSDLPTALSRKKLSIPATALCTTETRLLSWGQLHTNVTWVIEFLNHVLYRRHDNPLLIITHRFY